jgi:hypothetical protein
MNRTPREREKDPGRALKSPEASTHIRDRRGVFQDRQISQAVSKVAHWQEAIERERKREKRFVWNPVRKRVSDRLHVILSSRRKRSLVRLKRPHCSSQAHHLDIQTRYPSAENRPRRRCDDCVTASSFRMDACSFAFAEIGFETKQEKKPE